MNCKKKTRLFLLVWAVVACLANAKETTPSASQGHRIQVQAPQLSNQKVFLGHYYMGKLYVKDSLLLDKQGKGSLVGKEPYHEGLYVMYYNTHQYFDLLIGADQQIMVRINDTTDLANHVQLEKARQTVDFQKYTRYLTDIQGKAKALREKAKSLKDSAEIKRIDAEIELMGIGVKHRQDSLIAKDPKGMLALFLTALRLPEFVPQPLPEGTQNPDSVRALERYLFYRDHYFDNMHLDDERVYYTPYIKNNLDNYFENCLIQNWDSILPPAMKLVEKGSRDNHSFQTLCSYVLDYSVKSTIMGMDNLMVELGRKYYLSGQATWADSTLRANIEKEIKKVEHALVGMKAPNIQFTDTAGVTRSIYDMGGTQLTVLFFYEPSCGHCRKTAPEIRDFYEKYKDDPRLNLIAIYMLTDPQEWKKFRDEQHLGNLQNVWDPERKSFYWYYYDTASTPMIYVIAQDHTIFAKRIDVETLKLIATNELK